MFVVQLYLPLEKSDGTPISPDIFERTKMELTDWFGGVTAFLQSPADGAWRHSGGEVVHDRVAIFEVMVEDVDTVWWRKYRVRLEEELEQDQILARLFQVSVL